MSMENFVSLPEIQPSSVRERKGKDIQIIDVRRPDEFHGELGHIQGAQFVTLETDFEEFLKKYSKDPTYVFVCRSGQRSGRATQMAMAAGFKNVFNMIGGMQEWNRLGFEVER